MVEVSFVYSIGHNFDPRNGFLPKVATTQPTTQNKTKQLGWCGYIIGKKTTPPPPPPPPHRVPLQLRQF